MPTTNPLTLRLLADPPVPDVIAELESLLAEAKAGRLRSIIFACVESPSGDSRFGCVGEYRLADFALAARLIGIELDALITRGSVND